jgi:hypothetical protein
MWHGEDDVKVKISTCFSAQNTNINVIRLIHYCISVQDSSLDEKSCLALNRVKEQK